MRKSVFLFLIIILFGCQSNIQRKIINFIEKRCDNQDSCQITMKDITNFRWEKMYVFEPSVRLDQINKVLGFKYEYFEDIARRIIFTVGDKVVYHEDDCPFSEEKSYKKIFFSFYNDSVHYEIFTLESAVFRVKKKFEKNSIYYELIQVK